MTIPRWWNLMLSAVQSVEYVIGYIIPPIFSRIKKPMKMEITIPYPTLPYLRSKLVYSESFDVSSYRLYHRGYKNILHTKHTAKKAYVQISNGE